MHKLDVCGLSCPLPVIEVNRSIQAGSLPLQVLTDVGAARENIMRLAETNKLAVKETVLPDGTCLLELATR